MNLMVSNFLKIRSFSIVCGDLKLNQKRKRKKMGRPMKAHRSNRPVNRSNRPVNRSEPVAWEFLNLFEFGFEFNRFPPVTGLTGPVNRYRRAAVRPVRSDFKTLLVMAVSASFFDSECMFQTLKVRTACGNEHSRGDGLSGNVSLLSGNEHRFINITMHLDILYV